MSVERGALTESGRIMMLALMFFLAALAVGVPLGFFWEELEHGLGTTLNALLGSTISWLAIACVAFGYAVRWPAAAVRRTLLAYVTCTVATLALVLLVGALLQLDAFEESPLWLVVDSVLGLLLALVAAAMGARRRTAR